MVMNLQDVFDVVPETPKGDVLRIFDKIKNKEISTVADLDAFLGGDIDRLIELKGIGASTVARIKELINIFATNGAHPPDKRIRKWKCEAKPWERHEWQPDYTKISPIVHHLSERQRRLVGMVYIEKLRPAQIARREKISESRATYRLWVLNRDILAIITRMP